METLNRILVEWGVSSRTLPGQTTSGDRHVVRQFPTGVLVAAIDGLGHGAEAAAAAALAVATLESHAEESVIALVRRCNERLRGTRGAVLSIASLNAADSSLTWLGVGNVAGVLVHQDPDILPSREILALRGGLVGDQLPRLYASVIDIFPGDTLIFTTDGIRDDFSETLDVSGPPQRTADRILAHSARGTDDALALVVRFLNRHDQA